MDFSGKKRIHFLSCRNEFFYKNSNGIIALRAEVEKVSGRAALDSGWAGPKERAKAVYIETGSFFSKFFESESLNSKKHSKWLPLRKGMRLKLPQLIDPNGRVRRWRRRDNKKKIVESFFWKEKRFCNFFLHKFNQSRLALGPGEALFLL